MGDSFAFSGAASTANTAMKFTWTGVAPTAPDTAPWADRAEAYALYKTCVATPYDPAPSLTVSGAPAGDAVSWTSGSLNLALSPMEAVADLSADAGKLCAFTLYATN